MLPTFAGDGTLAGCPVQGGRAGSGHSGSCCISAEGPVAITFAGAGFQATLQFLLNCSHLELSLQLV